MRMVTKEGSKKPRHQTEVVAELFGEISDVSIEISSDELEDLEPDDVDTATSKADVRPQPSTGKVALTGWSPDPKPPMEGPIPACEKKLELRQPACPIKMPSVTKSSSIPAATGGPPLSVRISSLIQGACKPPTSLRSEEGNSCAHK